MNVFCCIAQGKKKKKKNHPKILLKISNIWQTIKRSPGIWQQFNLVIILCFNQWHVKFMGS